MFSVNINIVLTVVCVAPPANKMSNHIICVHLVPPTWLWCAAPCWRLCPCPWARRCSRGGRCQGAAASCAATAALSPSSSTSWCPITLHLQSSKNQQNKSITCAHAVRVLPGVGCSDAVPGNQLSTRRLPRETLPDVTIMDILMIRSILQYCWMLTWVAAVARARAVPGLVTHSQPLQ